MWNKGKHNVEEINGTRCSIVESDAGESRMRFLKELLEHNRYQVLCEKNEDKYKIGVTDLLFNPVIDVYKRRLFTKTGEVVTFNNWFQLASV